jgi:hypothetical protein
MLALALTLGGGAWLGLNRSKFPELRVVVPERMSETSAQASMDSSEVAVDAAADMQVTKLLATSPDSSPRQVPAELSSDSIRDGTPSSAASAESLTQGISAISDFSLPGLPGEVLLRALLVEYRHAMQQRSTGAKSMLSQVASGFGLEMLPIRTDLSRLKQFRVACLLETYLPNTSEPTFLILHAVSPEGVELTDASGELRRLEDAELGQRWSGQVYLFHRRGLELKQILARGKQRLKDLGYLQTDPSGLFDDDTTEAVRRLQKDHALQVDGSAGPATKILLYYLVGRSLAEARQE